MSFALMFLRVSFGFNGFPQSEHLIVGVFNGRELFSPAQKYQLLVYHADAIFHDKEYRNAACKYSMALQQKKVLSKTSKVRTSTGGAASNIQAQVCLTISCNQKQTEIYNSTLVTWVFIIIFILNLI